MKKLALMIVPMVLFLSGCVVDREEYVRVFNESNETILVSVSPYETDDANLRLRPGEYADFDVLDDILVDSRGIKYTYIHYSYYSSRNVVVDADFDLSGYRTEVRIYDDGIDVD